MRQGSGDRWDQETGDIRRQAGSRGRWDQETGENWRQKKLGSIDNRDQVEV